MEYATLHLVLYKYKTMLLL